MNETYNAYMDVANAIILQACEDYFFALRNIKKYDKDNEKENRKYFQCYREIKAIELFFRSEWFRELSRYSIEPEFIIKVVREREKHDKGFKKSSYGLWEHKVLNKDKK